MKNKYIAGCQITNGAQRRIVNTTLGDLVVRLTDEVDPYIREPASMYLAVSCILTELLARQLVFVPWLGRHEQTPTFH